MPNAQHPCRRGPCGAGPAPSEMAGMTTALDERPAASLSAARLRAQPVIDWLQLKPVVLAAIMEHFTSGRPVTTGGAVPVEAGEEADTEVVSQIKELLETRVRPAVAQDGGDIIFQRFEDGVVYLHMQGSCSGCPSSTATLKAGIENMLRHYIPEVQEVRPV